MQKRATVKINGRVQGVFYRSHIKACADKLAIAGFVENKPDGTVLLVAEGEEEQLKVLLESASEGSTASRVSDVEVSWSDVTNEFKNFEVR